MRVLALDIGEKRVGIAISDPDQSVATPLCVLDAHEVINNAESFRRVLEDWQPELLVCGLPCTLSGDEGSQAEHIREQALKIARSCNLDCAFVDERLSSTQAKRILHESGYDERSMRGKVDMIAASLFLQNWLDEHAPTENER